MESEQNIFDLLYGDCVKSDIASIKSKMLITLTSALRSKSAKTPTEIALILGCTKSEACNLKNGRVDSMSIEKLLKHLAGVNVRVSASLIVDFDGDERFVNGFSIKTKVNEAEKK